MGENCVKIRAAERWDLAFSRLKFKLVKNPEKNRKKEERPILNIKNGEQKKTSFVENDD